MDCLCRCDEGLLCQAGNRTTESWSDPWACIMNLLSIYNCCLHYWMLKSIYLIFSSDIFCPDLWVFREMRTVWCQLLFHYWSGSCFKHIFNCMICHQVTKNKKWFITYDDKELCMSFPSRNSKILFEFLYIWVSTTHLKWFKPSLKM